jgi:cytoplasmic iron level regulating protein YaaA (DUF328/UPF0246 family)
VKESTRADDAAESPVGAENLRRYVHRRSEAMRIIISPAKKMITDTDVFAEMSMPAFLDRAEILRDWIRGLSYDEQKKLWACSAAIAEQNHERFARMELHRNLTPAILAYDGIQFQYMAPAVFEDGQFAYVQSHLRILSGFYGVLRPMDGVVPYRLEMQAKAEVHGCRNLYEFWNDLLYREVMDESRILINLASKEYSRCIEKFLQPEDRYITCVFGELEKEKVVQKGVYAKMARGEMVRFLADIHAEVPERMKEFAWSGYHYDAERSSDREYVFLRSEIPGKRIRRKSSGQMIPGGFSEAEL